MRLHHPFIILSIVTALSASAAEADKTQDAMSIGNPVSEIGKDIFHVFQAKNTNYWFGSAEQGVYRFDGYTLTHFTTKDGLANNRIRGIQEDKAGNIYFITMAWDGARRFGDAISKFDGKTFNLLSATDSTSSARAWKLQPDDLWFAGAQDSGVVYRYDGRTLHRLRFPKTKAGEEHISKYPRSEYPNMTYNPYDVYIIYKDRKGNIWFGTNLGVCCYNGNSFTWISEEELGFDEVGRAFNVRSISEDKAGKFWFSNTTHCWNVAQNNGGRGINFRKENGIEPANRQNPDDFAYFISSVTDDSGDLWMATLNAGVWRYDGKKLVHYPIKDGNSTVRLFSIYKDNQGDLWLGSHTAGVFKFNGTTFKPFKF